MTITAEQLEAALLPQRETTPPVPPEPEPAAESTEGSAAVATSGELGAVDAVADEGAAPPVEATAETPEETAQRERNEKGQFVKGAGKKAATPADVPRIHELTAKLRAAERERDEWRQKHEAAARPPAPVPQTPQTAPPARQDAPGSDFSTFNVPEPKLEDFASEPDAYAEWVTARAEWRIEKKQHAEMVKQADAAAERQVREWTQTYQQREDAFKAAHPDWDDTIRNGPPVHNPLLAAAIQLDPDGPALLYNLLKQGNFLQIHFLTDGKPVNEFTVQTVQSLLKTSAAGAVTASPAPMNGKKPLPTPLKAVPSGPLARQPVEEGSDDEPIETYIKRGLKELRSR